MPATNEDLGGDLTPAEAAEYTEAYRRGSGLVSRHMNLHDRERAAAEMREAELREGIRLLQRAVAIQPRSWPAWWLIGKGHQALGDHPRAYEAFRLPGVRAGVAGNRQKRNNRQTTRPTRADRQALVPGVTWARTRRIDCRSSARGGRAPRHQAR
jgi:hypothetical protein